MTSDAKQPDHEPDGYLEIDAMGDAAGNLSRRQFLGTSALGILAVGAGIGCTEERGQRSTATSGTSPFDRPLGFQSYGVRREIERDFTGTLERVRELGYASVEMCSPRGNYYRTAGYGNLTDLPPAEIKQQIEDAGLVCKSAHFEPHEVVVDDPARTADYAAALGLQDIVMSGSGIADDGTVDDIRRWAEIANRAAEVVRAAGLRLGYHNHAIGPQVEGRPQYEHIMEALDPDLVTMQFQLASIAGGYDIVYYLERYAGRYSSLHMHDYDPAMKGREPGRLGGIVPCGEGMIDWPALLQAALQSDIADHGFIVEIETEEPLEGLRRSIEFLRTVTI
ncbi:MAG: TIM barrel protein [Gemmatimonadales bacterium]|nr:TIM barrel protein [Gemmatimonadales bacterium]NIQ99423.1 TIM barrel protein [Gemmatimonadales bacterium]NIS64091.1 TIM barrel protein [Gemmatimonadales bacterium]